MDMCINSTAYNIYLPDKRELQKKKLETQKTSLIKINKEILTHDISLLVLLVAGHWGNYFWDLTSKKTKSLYYMLDQPR